jgi:hypothetical protein
MRKIDDTVRDRIEAARGIIMRAQFMAMCGAGATVSEIVGKERAIEVTLMYVSEILGRVADDLDPANLLLSDGEQRWYPPTGGAPGTDGQPIARPFPAASFIPRGVDRDTEAPSL